MANGLTAGDLTPLRSEVYAAVLTRGSHAAVFRVDNNGRTYVVKVGDTEHYYPPFLATVHVKVSRQKVSDFLVKHFGESFKIMPDEAGIREGQREYRILASYLSDQPCALALRRGVVAALGDRHDAFASHVQGLIGDYNVEKLRVVAGRHIDESFLPRECTAIGHPPARAQAAAPHGSAAAARVTYYIIQDGLVGPWIQSLNQLSKVELKGKATITEALITLILLAKKMYWDTGRLIDTRPDEVARHPLEWFQQTSNILVDSRDDRAFFVDTRWLWNAESVLGRGGLNLVETLGLKSLNRALRVYLALLSS